GHAEMVFESDLRSILDLLGRSAHHSGQPGCSHGGSRSDFSLTADLGAGNGSIVLYDTADCRGCEKKGTDILLRGVLVKMPEIADRRRDDAGCPVCGCRHDPPASCILLVHRHGVNAEP